MGGLLGLILAIILAIGIFTAPKCKNCGKRCTTSRTVKDNNGNIYCTKKCAKEYHKRY